MIYRRFSTGLVALGHLPSGFSTSWDNSLCLGSLLRTKSFVSLIFHTLLSRVLFLGPLSLSLSLPISLGRVLYIFVVRFSNGLARVSSASSVAHFEVGTSGGTFAPRAPQCDTTTESAPRSLFSRRTETMRLFFTLTMNIISSEKKTTRCDLYYVAAFCYIDMRNVERQKHRASIIYFVWTSIKQVSN